MRKYLFIILVSSYCISQEKSQINYKNEVVTITVKDKLKIESFNSESRTISKSKNTYEYLINLYFDSFSEISDIKGTTLILKNNKKHYLNTSSVNTFAAEHDGIFVSDSKIKQFSLPSVEDNSIIEYSYKNTIKEPRFLNSFRFQSPIKTRNAKFQLKCDPSVEIGYKLFGNHQDKISFEKTTQDNLVVYTWEAKDIPEFESEDEMPNSSYFIPHLIYYVKSYEINGKKEDLLSSPEKLYLWYSSLVKNINKKDETKLKSKTLELIKGKSTEFEKAKAIFEWVQQNLHYVAFENGMGGFIPREAADVYEKLYGDCKDMANLLNQMLHYADLKSSLTWIGTRIKPYTYNDVPTPQVDNHMITNVVIDGKSYFLDATDKFCPFTYPSAMIQGKEAMIRKSDNDFIIENVPIVSSENNKIDIQLKLKIEDNKLQGEAASNISGLFKSELLNQLAVYNQKESEIWKSIINATNSKILLEPVTLEKNDYQAVPSKSKFNLKLDDGIKLVSDKILLKPMFIFPLKGFLIDTEKRKFSIEKDFAFIYDIQYQYEIPQGYKVEFIPENTKQDTELASFYIQYRVENNSIIVSQKVASKKIIIDNKDFELWNSFIKSLNKQYNQSLILSK